MCIFICLHVLTCIYSASTGGEGGEGREERTGRTGGGREAEEETRGRAAPRDSCERTWASSEGERRARACASSRGGTAGGRAGTLYVRVTYERRSIRATRRIRRGREAMEKGAASTLMRELSTPRCVVSRRVVSRLVSPCLRLSSPRVPSRLVASPRCRRPSSRHRCRPGSLFRIVYCCACRVRGHRPPSGGTRPLRVSTLWLASAA